MNNSLGAHLYRKDSGFRYYKNIVSSNSFQGLKIEP